MARVIAAGHVRVPWIQHDPRAAVRCDGSILALKRPGNPIGWLFLFGALFAGLNELSDGYAIWSVAGKGSTTTLARLAAVGEEWLWIVAFTMLSIVLAVFPDGRPLSRRWKRVLAVALTGTAVSVIAYVLTDSPSVFKQVDNPLAVPGMADVANTTIAFFFLLLMAGFANLVIRFRRTSGDEHEQLKWLAASTAFLVSRSARISSASWSTAPMQRTPPP